MSLNLQTLKGSGISHTHSFNSNLGPNLNIDKDSLMFSKIEVLFAERIVPLLDGTAFFKKFSSRQSLNENAFDPLNSDKYPPE